VIRLRGARSGDEARPLLESQRSCPCRAIGFPEVQVNPCSAPSDSGYRDNRRNRIEELLEAILR
jgi:hypothetical protein